jgi:hypothetical protein
MAEQSAKQASLDSDGEAFKLSWVLATFFATVLKYKYKRKNEECNFLFYKKKKSCVWLL